MFDCHWFMAIWPKIDECSVSQADRRRKTVHQHVVPLVEDGDSPIAFGKTGQT